MKNKQIPVLRFPEFTNEWNDFKLGNIARFSKGKGISKSDIVENGKTECIRYGELYTKYDEIINDVFSRTNISTDELVLSEENDVIIPASGETEDDIATASCVLRSGIAIGSDINIIKTDNDGVFLSYYLNNKKKTDIASMAQGISIVHLYSSQLSMLTLNLPDVKEQIKISNFFKSIDARIKSLRNKREILSFYKNGLVQKIFSQKIRFKDEEGKEYMNWEWKRLGDLCLEHLNRNDDNIFNEVFSVAKHKGVINQIEHLGRSYAAKNISNYKLIYPDDLVYTKSPTSDFPFGIIKQNRTGRTGVVSPLYCVFKPNNPSLGYILHEYFNSSTNTYNYLYPIVQKGAKNTMNINNSDFLHASKLFLPIDEKEQQKITLFLSIIDQKINMVDALIRQTKDWKKGILQTMLC